MAKQRIIKDYSALPAEVIEKVKMAYPSGYAEHLISYNNAKGEKVSALPFETEDIYYLIRMTIKEAKQIVSDDEDFDDDGLLREDFGGDMEPDGFDAEEDDDVDDKQSDAEDHIIPSRRGRSLDPDDYSDEDY